MLKICIHFLHSANLHRNQKRMKEVWIYSLHLQGENLRKNLILVQSSHSDWKYGKAFLSQGKVREF